MGLAAFCEIIKIPLPQQPTNEPESMDPSSMDIKTNEPASINDTAGKLIDGFAPIYMDLGPFLVFYEP